MLVTVDRLTAHSAHLVQQLTNTMLPIMSPMSRRRVGVMETASQKAAAAALSRLDLDASAPSATCVYASAATGSTSVDVVLQVGTVGLQVLRRAGRSRSTTKSTDGSDGSVLRPLRTLAYGGILSTQVVAVRAVPLSQLTGGHPTALIVEYRDGTAFTRHEKIFCFMATEEANRINSCLTDQLKELRRAAKGSRVEL